MDTKTVKRNEREMNAKSRKYLCTHESTMPTRHLYDYSWLAILEIKLQTLNYSIPTAAPAALSYAHILYIYV